MLHSKVSPAVVLSQGQSSAYMLVTGAIAFLREVENAVTVSLSSMKCLDFIGFSFFLHEYSHLFAGNKKVKPPSFSSY